MKINDSIAQVTEKEVVSLQEKARKTISQRHIAQRAR